MKRRTSILRATNFDFLGPKYTGKVSDVYAQKDRTILIPTDRHSSFDRNITFVPHKGQVINQSNAWWFEILRDIVPNHMIAIPDPNVMIADRCTPLKIEAVVRGYLTGVTGTSIWVRYSKGERTFGGLTLPDGMRKNEPLPQAIFDPTTKEKEHDRTIPMEQMIAEGFIIPELLEQVKAISLALFARGQEVAASRGRILVDTKYEFGLDDYGNLVLIDEVHTPDSSRYWVQESYERLLRLGKEPESFDKEFLRLWLIERCNPYKDTVLPVIPMKKRMELSSRYIEMYEVLTGERFQAGETPIIPRIKRNLQDYAV